MTKSMATEIDEQEKKKLLLALKSNPVLFAKYVLGIIPFIYQEKFLLDEARRLAVCAGRQIGKSFMTSAKAIWYAFTHGNTKTLIVSPSLRQSIMMFDTVMSLIESQPLLINSVRHFTRTKITLKNGSTIIALPCGPTGKTIRGQNASLIVVDEAAFVPEGVISEVILPMLATTRGTVIMLST